MAIDLKLMEEKLKASKAGKSLKGNNESSKHKLTLKEGYQEIRLLPSQDGDPFKEYQFHYNFSKGPGFLCPKRNFGERCSACEFATELWQTGDPEKQKLAKDLFAKNRFFSHAIMRGQEEEGAKIWGYSKTVYETLVAWVVNPKIGDFTDPVKGRDLGVTYTAPTTPAGFYSTKAELDPAGASPFMSDKKESDRILKNLPDFFEMHPRVSSDEVDEKLNSFMADQIGVEEASSETEKYGGEPEEDDASESVSEMTIDDAFAKFSK